MNVACLLCCLLLFVGLFHGHVIPHIANVSIDYTMNVNGRIAAWPITVHFNPILQLLGERAIASSFSM